MTVVFDRVNSVLESVKLCKVPGYKTCVRILFFSAGKWVFFLGSGLDLLLCNVFVGFFCYNSDVNKVGVPREKALNCVEFVSILIIQSREGFELEIYGGCPIKSLFRELKLVSISNAHRDVVIILQPFDATPEHQFFKVGSVRCIYQYLKTVLEVESK